MRLVLPGEDGEETHEFNGDTRSDLAVANSGSSNVSVLLGNGDGTFAAGATVPAGNYPSSVVVGEFNGDTRSDLAVANRNSYNVSILLGNGDGTFAAGATVPVGDFPFSVVVGEFN